MESKSGRLRAALVPILAMLLLVGCSSAVPMEPADDATNPACADIIVRLPAVVGDAAKRDTDAQATGAWGTPAVVLLRCGVPVPGPSTQRCVTVEDVDWLIDDSDPERGVFTTYGRDPAVQVVVDASFSESTALNDLADAVGINPAERACTTPEDATTGEDPLLVP